MRAEHGTTGIDQIARALQKMMREELTEKVETVYADVFWLPLVVAIAFLFNETFVFDTPWRRPWTVGKIVLAAFATLGVVSLIVLLVDLWRGRVVKKSRGANA